MVRLRSVGAALVGPGARRSLRRWWAAHRWPTFGLVALVFFALALWGYKELYGNHLGWADLVYISLATFRDSTTLYNIKGVRAVPPFPVPLEWARFGAPLTLVIVGLSAVASAFKEPFTLLRIRLLRPGHLVVCGLGQFGQRLVAAFDERGLRVVAVDCNPSPVVLAACRARAVPVVVGDATTDQVLRWAGIRRAATLVAVCGEGSVNAEVGLIARHLVEEPGGRRSGGRGHGQLGRGRSRRLRCFVQVDDDELSRVLEAANMTESADGPEDARVEIHFVNVFQSGPGILLRRYRDSFTEIGGRPPHIVVVGTDRIGLRLMVGAARQWYIDHPGGNARLKLTLVASDAEDRFEELRRRYPHFEESCEVTLYPAGASEADGAVPELVPAGPGRTTAFVCFPDEATSLRVGLRLARGRPDVEVVTINTEQSAKITLLDVAAGSRHLPNLRTFPLLDNVCRPENLVDTVSEQLARALHEIYLRNRALDGTYDPAGQPTHREWDELPEDARESNRAAGRGYARHLRHFGYTVAPVEDWDVPMAPLTDHEVAAMSKMEHERWCSWMRARGKKSPQLVPWEALPEAERRKDTEIIVELPRELARLGLAVVPESASRQPPGDDAGPGGGDRTDELARVIHADYVRRRLAEGAEPADPSLVPWDSLAETLKDSNRDQARDIEAKLAAIGCRIVPAGAASQPVLHLESAEIERLAHLEHARWVRERLADGWHRGETKDVQARRSPDPVPWSELSEPARQLDRDTVRRIPGFLADLGFAVVRTANVTPRNGADRRFRHRR